MFNLEIHLSNRVETIVFYSQWAAGYFVESKGITKCADVEQVILVDAETGEVIAQWL